MEEPIAAVKDLPSASRTGVKIGRTKIVKKGARRSVQFTATRTLQQQQQGEYSRDSRTDAEEDEEGSEGDEEDLDDEDEDSDGQSDDPDEDDQDNVYEKYEREILSPSANENTEEDFAEEAATSSARKRRRMLAPVGQQMSSEAGLVDSLESTRLSGGVVLVDTSQPPPAFVGGKGRSAGVEEGEEEEEVEEEEVEEEEVEEEEEEVEEEEDEGDMEEEVDEEFEIEFHQDEAMEASGGEEVAVKGRKARRREAAEVGKAPGEKDQQAESVSRSGRVFFVVVNFGI